MMFRTCAAVLLACSAQQAGSPTPKPRPSLPDCSAAEFRQFDFWLGEWDVIGPKGNALGSNRIVAVQQGCGLREDWTSASGITGTSLNFYDRDERKWFQAWTDNTGGALRLAGRLQGRNMVLQSEPTPPDAKGERTINRITWSPIAAGRLRQLWETSIDGGKSWTIAFDGAYVKR
jgi:hypothetical protein